MTQKIASIPTNLFIDTPEMQDVSLHQLGTDTDSWPEEILQKLKERIPQASGCSTMVKFMKRDDENGAAVGSIVVNNSEKSAIIPLIIKDFKLYPLDVMITETKLLPLTPDYFAHVFSDNKVFAKIEEFPTFGGLGRFEDANLWNAIYPPSMGRYAYASAGAYPILEEIAPTIDGSGLKEWVGQNEKAAARFSKHGHAELFKKLANLAPVNMNEFRQGAINLIPRSISMLRFDGPNKYTLLQNANGVFSPAITQMSRDEACRFVSKVSGDVDDAMNEVDRNGEKLLASPYDDGGIYLAHADKDLVECADHFGHYAVKNKNGVLFRGLVIPKVIDFDQKITDLKMFASEGMSTVQKDIYGVKLTNHRFEIEGAMPRVGQTGCFVFQPDQGHALATVPVTVESVVTTSGELRLVCSGMLGEPIKIHVDPSMELKRIARAHDYYIIPHAMKWFPMEGFDQVTSSVEDYMVKTAGERLTNRPVTLIPTGYNQYALRGVAKYANDCGWDATYLARSQAKFLLASLGLGAEKIAEIMTEAHRRGHVEIHGLKAPPLAAEKIAAARPMAEKLTKIARSLRRDLIKEASYFENSQTVDALLSLNFVNPENVAKFVGKIPSFKACISHLASCLIASRLGIQEINELSAATAMNKLIEVVDGLEKLRAAQEVGVG